MATCNGAQFLQAQLNSFVTQTRLPDELVVTDDCSTDSTVEILERFAKTAPFKVFIHRNERNFGYCGNFSQALLRTKGDLVFISDQDDVWFPEKIERMASFAADCPEALVVMNDAALTDSDLADTGLTKLGQIRSAGFKEGSFVMGCCAAIKRDLLDLCLPIPEGFDAHDTWVVGIANGLGRRRILPEVLQYYRRHGSNESHWIVNRTTRVTRWHVRADRWKNLFIRLCSVRPDAGLAKHPLASPLWLRRQWAEEALKKSPEPYLADIRRYFERVDRHFRSQAQRATIRKLPFPARLKAVLKFWREGGYASRPKWKGAFKDLTGE